MSREQKSDRSKISIKYNVVRKTCGKKPRHDISGHYTIPLILTKKTFFELRLYVAALAFVPEQGVTQEFLHIEENASEVLDGKQKGFAFVQIYL